MRNPNQITGCDPVAAGVKLITNDQRDRCRALAAIYRDRFRLCSPDQSALAETFRQGALLLQEIAE
jgi:hypothetical protein